IQFYFDVHNNQYQVDIVAVYGYQLTLISVTTHKTKLLWYNCFIRKPEYFFISFILIFLNELLY
ncbi:MAG TPA: hypothetical protein PLN17_04855, partial [Candidatus Cloacimonas sp.]|nr:hypothetical protein [Candidatus Cloacimonas sp.]HQJ96430.1 hypothetical protein [Candidatus Cloacimonas sp.]